MYKTNILFTFIAVVAMILFIPAQSISQITSEKLEQVDRYVFQQYQRFGLPGVAVSIAVPDSVVFAKGYGFGNVAGDPVSAETSFYIGSITKTFTAFAIAKLVEENLIELDAPVEQYIPGFTMRSPYTPGSITVRHLLHHYSGLSQWDGHNRKAQNDGTYHHLSPKRPAEEKFEYSSLNFMILGNIIETITHQTYADYLDYILFTPLGLNHSFIENKDYSSFNVIQGHKNYFGFHRAQAEPEPPHYLIPAGHLAASAHDLGRYGAMLIGNGSYQGNEIISEETANLLFNSPYESGPSMSWGRGTRYDSAVFGHSGNAQTSSARMRLLPERGYAISVLTNTGTGPFFDSSQELLNGINDILEGYQNDLGWPKERFFKGAILAGTLLVIGGMAYQGKRWHDEGYHLGIEKSGKIMGRLAFDLGAAAVIAFGLPRYIGVPLTTMVDYFPDLGIAIIASAGAGAIGGIFRAFASSAQ